MSTIPQEFPHLPDDISAALDSYEDRLSDGRLHYNERGDIVPYGPEEFGWLEFVNERLPDMDIHANGALQGGRGNSPCLPAIPRPKTSERKRP